MDYCFCFPVSYRSFYKIEGAIQNNFKHFGLKLYLKNTYLIKRPITEKQKQYNPQKLHIFR